MLLLQHVKAVANAGCNMVVTGGKVGEMALHFLNKHKIMVVRWASPSFPLSSPLLPPSLHPFLLSSSLSSFFPPSFSPFLLSLFLCDSYGFM